MSNYSSGKFSKFISDRSGMQFPYKERITEWNGSVVHISEYEEKHPQLEPLPHVIDPEALYKPRPNQDLGVGEGFVVVVYTDITKGNSMDPNIVGSNFVVDKMTGSVGEVTITT